MQRSSSTPFDSLSKSIYLSNLLMGPIASFLRRKTDTALEQNKLSTRLSRKDPIASDTAAQQKR